MNSLKDMKLRTKFMAYIGLILVVLMIIDVKLSMDREKRIMFSDIETWSFTFSENVRVTLNTLMREGKMDLRFNMFDAMTKEINGLKVVRVIRGEKVDELFKKVREDEEIPREEAAIKKFEAMIVGLQEDLKKVRDKDEQNDIKEEIESAENNISRSKEKIKKIASVSTVVDEREKPRDEFDKEVLKTGKPIYRFEGDNARVLIPYIVKKEGCREASGCHKLAKEGDVLGAINMEFSIADINREIRKNNLKSVGVGVFRLGVILAVIVLLLSSIVLSGIDRLISAFDRLSDGDLTVRLPIEGKDEMGKLAKGFNIYIESFVDIIKETQNATRRLAASSQELQALAVTIAGGTETQTAKTLQVAGASEELRATLQEVAKNITNLSASSESASDAAQKGGELVSGTVEGMNKVADTVRDSSRVIAQLGQRSGEIGEIIKVIDDIADQTNLLALNAAIEAARAGEHGRGFAVVADEVRKLAEKTAKATKEIAKMIKAVQNETDEAVQSIESGTKQVEVEVALAGKVQVALENMVSDVAEVSQMIEQIASAAEEQSAAADQISEDIEAVANVTKDTAQGASHLAESADDLSNLSSELNKIVSRFKIS